MQWDSTSLDIRRYVAIILRRKWLIAGIIGGALLLGLLLTLMATPVYVARTTFEVQRDAPRVLDMNSIESDTTVDQETFALTQFALIKSRSLAEGIVRRLKLDQNPEFLDAGISDLFDDGGTITAAEQRQKFDAATAKVMSGIMAQSYEESSLIEVSFESHDPRLAAQVANAAVDEFIESTIQRRFAASSYAREFLGNRLNEVKQRLEKSERDLVDYATRQHIINVTDARTEGGTSQSLDSANLVALNGALAQARTNRIMAEQKWALAREGDGQALAEVRSSPELIALNTKLTGLAADYQDKLKTFKPSFPAMIQLQAQIDELRRQGAAIRETVLKGIQTDYELAVGQERLLSEQVDALKNSVMDLQNRSIQYKILQREVDTNRQLYDGLLQRFKEIGVAGGSGANNMSVIDRARVPASPDRPILWLNMFLALVGGTVLALAVAFGIEFIDDTVKVPDDVESKLQLAMLGTIPKLEEGENPHEKLADVRSNFSEAYYSVRTALQLASATGMPRNLLITSFGPSEGKSTSSVALARSFARGGMRVLLIDADLRKPSLHRVMGQSNARGLSNVISQQKPFQEVVVHIDESLDFIPCGPLPPNPAQLLTAGTLKMLLQQLAQQYDLVVLDGPPVIGLADAPMLSATAEATVMVIEAGNTRRAAILSALRRLQASRSNIMGAILTKFDQRATGYGYEYSQYYYSYGNTRQADE